MIDLSFLTEAEQEAILKVLNRDAELKKSEDQRVKNLHDVVHDDNEFKYKSGQWFYDAKSKRHREKIHGVDLVRASIRKRKKPATIAELGELNKESSKRRWVNGVNQDLFIPPELFGVMEAPDEAEEDIMVKKQEGNQSSKKVGFTSEKEQENLRNGIFSPPKARQNPFNSEGLQDDTDYNNEAPSLNPKNVQMNGTEKPKTDIMSSLAKYGVKLPYPELSKSKLNTPKAQDGNNSQKEDVPIPVPKPRTFKVNGQPQDRSNSTLKRDDSLNDEEPLYAVVNKTPAASSPSQAQDKKPEVGSSEVLNSKPDQLNSSSPTEDIPVNSFPQNAETLKRLSQSVPAFINDDICHCTPVLIVCKTVDTDGRDTDSASESSFQIGRHKKSPSSLTNLSGSSGMASMSSVSGSVMSIYSGDFGNVDIKGGIEFSIDYVEQLKEFLIYIYQCRELAVAEPKKQRSDPYVKAYLLPEKAKMGKRKTAVKKKTLNPVYNEILRYKIPKQSLLAQALNLSVWHHDALGRNSFLGEVNVNLGTWDWSDTQRKWYQLEARTPAAGIGLENRGEMKLSLKYVPMSSSGDIASFVIHNQILDPQHRRASGSKPNLTGEVHISIKDCLQLPMLRENKINSFVKCTVLPDTSRKSRQRTRTVDKTPNPYFNHTMVYDGFKAEDLREACVELTVWDHNRLSNHFLGGIRIGLGTGKSYGTPVDWMDSTPEEAIMWEKMMTSPNTWIDGMLPLRMFKMAKLAK
ncbi:synaptotagmin-like protein 2 isoform X11 [Rana temporaria]|uniref:synaptotagmin-like protein 2 isoform X11 n=1 Tax=Rana temporaria TaxID=8407 RepID=UPI001AAD9332|nr:synaptotagmin-like protein 2 isoform X11 [Rana temporaria]